MTIEEFTDALAMYDHLEESVLEQVVLYDFGLRAELHIRYVDVKQLADRPVGLLPKFLIRCNVVENLTLRNALTEAMSQEPERMNWGFGEFATIEVTPAPLGGAHTLELLWENDHRLTVTAAAFELIASCLDSQEWTEV